MINLGSFRTRIAKSLTIRGPKGPVKQRPKLFICKINQNCEKIVCVCICNYDLKQMKQTQHY